MKARVQRIERQLWWSDVNAKIQGIYAIFDWSRRYGNGNGNSRSAASGTLWKFCGLAGGKDLLLF